MYSCPYSCGSCSSSSNCNSCKGGYYLSDGKCNSCSSNCYKCTDNTKCTTCNGHYYLSSNYCYQCSSSCNHCTSSSTKCTSCYSGYYLSSYNCYPCVSPCKTCSSSTSCNSCISKYYLSSNKCYPCVNPCVTCSSQTSCNSCVNGYFLISHTCYECNYNCKTTSDGCKCSTCYDGYYLYNYQCLNCKEPCKTCSSETKCLSCIDKYFLIQDTCYECNFNCKTSNDNCRCDSCNDGYYLLNYQCIECDNNCKTCIDFANNCLSCYDEFYLTDRNTCTNCIEPCKKCSSKTKCLSCIDNYFLVSGICNLYNINCKTSPDNCRCSTCDIGYYFNNYQCLDCDSNCRTCSNKANYCTSCDENKYLYENSCLNCDESCNNTKINETEINEKEEEIKFYDEVIENINSLFTSELYDTSYLDSGNDEVMEMEKIKIVLTTTENQKNNKNENMTYIDLGQCESLLRDFYNITDDKLYMKKIDIIQDDMKIPKIEYAVYSRLNGSNLVELNLSICQDSKISLLVPLEITESLDKLNTSSEYFNSICYTTTSENGTDISLSDRQKEYKEQNKAICQDECDLYNYNYTTKKVNCSCKAKQSSVSFVDMKINKTQLYKNFLDVENIININILICYKTLFTKDGIIYNIGSFIIITIIIFHIICIFIFCFKQYKILQNKIKHIFFAIVKSRKNKNTNKGLTKNDKDKNKIRHLRNNNKNINKKKINTIKTSNILKKDDNKKNIKSIQIKNNTKEKTDNSIIEIDNPLQKNYFNFINFKNKKRNKSQKNFNNKNQNKKLQKQKKNNSMIKNLPKRGIRRNDGKGNKNINNINAKKYKKEKRKNLKKVLDYIDEEINSLHYNLAIRFDKRKYCQFYKSLLKTQHDFIFAFFQGDDYNSRIVKIDFFFVCFAIFYTVNGLFFDDNTMHKIYESNGSFDFEYQIPKIIYSSLISMVLNKIFGLLALSNNAVIKFKENKTKKDADKRKTSLEKNLKIKFAFYFILSFLFLSAFWYYIAMFGAIYKNTQMHLLKDTLMSFGLSLIYPFIIYLFPGIFRILALSDRKGKRKCLYDFSRIIQMF